MEVGHRDETQSVHLPGLGDGIRSDGRPGTSPAWPAQLRGDPILDQDRPFRPYNPGVVQQPSLTSL